MIMCTPYRFLLQVLALLPIVAHGDVSILNTLAVDSDYVEYKGKQISLNGNVTIEHDLGSIMAKSIELIPEKGEENKLTYSFILNGDVKVLLKEGGILNCAQADVHFSTKMGYFHSSSEQPFVTYMEKCPDKTGQLLPLQVQSRDMVVQIENTTTNEMNARTSIGSIEAMGDVTVNYNNDFVALANRGSYKRISDNGVKTALPGLITLSSNENSNDLCQVTNKYGDIIRSQQICIDTVKRHIWLKQPKGTLGSKGSIGLSQQPIAFNSDCLVWDDLLNTLILTGNISIQQNGFGTLSTQDEVRIFKQTSNENSPLRAIEAKGKTLLTYLSEDEKMTHVLTCYGKLLVDHEHYKTVMTSPVNDKGQVLEGQQLCLKDDLGELYADNLTIYYNIINQKLTPVKVLLEGHVTILNNGAIDPEKSKAFLEYAISDTLEYNPKEQEVLMSSIGKKRVLFFDRINNLQVSAPALKIRRNTKSNKDSIQGIGDVRFSFVKHEIEEIEKQFHLILNEKKKAL